MKTINILILASLAATVSIISCKKESAATVARTPQLPDEVFKYDEISTGSNGFNPAGNFVIDNNKSTLGRVLFYETQLSRNNRVSCGSCHLQSAAFADVAKLSNGFENAKTIRNTPAIINAGTQTSYFWDMREANLSAMVTQPIGNHIEMGLDQPEYILAKLKKLPYYESLFQNAYGSSEITMDRVGDALSNFVASMASVKTKYDAVVMGQTSFTAEEERGRTLFFNDLPCGSCHGGENFSGWGSMTQNIGLEMDYVDDGEPGTDWMTGAQRDGWFKVPSLRNVALTAPYMHDGRFATLEEVVDFYNEGIQPHEQLSFMLREGWNGGFGPFEGDVLAGGDSVSGVQPLRLNLSDNDKHALVAFLKSLSDGNITSDVKFSDPFVAASN
ncbi:MAG: cytochrome-c peroxidase [Flavobacteriales bacterium]|nr:cytochrome-c peroxidase [Flavobacteriales bacterium]